MATEQFSRKEIFLSYITILRLFNGIVAGFAAAFGVVLSYPDGITVDPLPIILVVIAAMLVSSQAMIFNDIADRDEDAINAPHRPLPTGKISVKTAWIYGIIVAALALGVAITIDVIFNLYGLSVAAAIIFGGLLDLYDFKLKKLGFWGNITIGLCVLALFVYGAIHTFLIYPGSPFAWVPIVVGACAASGNVGREAIKGLPDIEGDREAGVRTLAVKFGKKKTAFIAHLFLLGLIAGALIALIYGGIILNQLYLPSAIIGCLVGAVAIFLAIAILFNQKPKWAYTTKEILLWVFLAFLLVFIIDKIIALILGR